MHWSQVLTIIAATIGSTYAFFMITKERIDRLEGFHREDMKAFKDEFKLIDEKWERLFERLLVQDKR